MSAAADLRQHPDFAHLTPVADGSAKAVAINIRADLKKHFKAAWPDVKFSVRTVHTDCVQVVWQDGPALEKVDALIRKYRDGSFDPMQDLYQYNVTPFNSVFGGIKYPSARREYSDALIERAIDIFRARYAAFRTLESLTVANYRSGKLSPEGRGFFTWGIQAEVRRILLETE